MKVQKKFLIALFFTAILLMLHSISYAGSQQLNSLHYDAKLNSDGSMDVVETWDIDIEETNTIFKDFNLDAEKYSGITNVEVMDLDTETKLTQIDHEMYHVTKNCYYGLPIANNKFEIAWGVGLDDDSATKKYRISYTVQDAITQYQDCSQLYWQFIGTDNAVPAKKVTGKIKLPSPVKNAENLRVWAHGPLNGEIQKAGNGEVTFAVSDLRPETMLEVRVTVEEEMFFGGIQKATKALSGILQEEERWAQEANNQREKIRKKWIIVGIVYLLVLLFLVTRLIKYGKQLSQTKKEKYSVEEIKYFRDIPREKEATPAEATFLCESNRNHFFIHNKLSQVFSATLLQLCLKKYITFESSDSKNMTIYCLKDNDEGLQASEKIVWEILQKASLLEPEKGITMKAIKKYASKNYDEFDCFMRQLEDAPKHVYVANGKYDVKKEKKANRQAILATMYVGMAVVVPIIAFALVEDFSIWLVLLPFILLCILCMAVLSKVANNIPVLTEQGEIERQQWRGLKRYMEDFSLLKEREVPDLILWEKYLVYATAFGISEKVIKQLKLVYPQMENLDRDTYTYLYLMSDHRFSHGFVSNLNQCTNGICQAYRTAYDAAHSSSESGSGGGFSSGGGGRWWRWPEWAEDKVC